MKISLLVVMFLIFTTLKLTDYIDWSWWIVTIPLVVHFWMKVCFLALKDSIKQIKYIGHKDVVEYMVIFNSGVWIPSILYTTLVIWFAA